MPGDSRSKKMFYLRDIRKIVKAREIINESSSTQTNPDKWGVLGKEAGCLPNDPRAYMQDNRMEIRCLEQKISAVRNELDQVQKFFDRLEKQVSEEEKD